MPRFPGVNHLRAVRGGIKVSEMRMSGQLTAKIIRSKTGREGYHLIRDEVTANKDVQEFVTKLCSDESEKSWPKIVSGTDVAKKISQQVRDAAEYKILGEYFRGRWFEEGKIPEPSEFGPPPVELQNQGRYNEGGQRVLYLAKTDRTVIAECSPSRVDHSLFIQKFEIDLPEAQIIKLTKSLEDEHPELHYLLLDSEFLVEEAPFFAAYPYRASHFIAYLCRLWDISAVEYPSVRGDFKNNSDAVNLVLFGDAIDSVYSMSSGLPVPTAVDGPK